MLIATVLGTLLVAAGAGLLAVGALGGLGRLPRNRFAGVRTPAALRSDAAFAAANRVAAPPVTAAGVVCAVGGVLTLGASGGMLAVFCTVTGVATLALVLVGGVLGDRAAAAIRPAPVGGCGGCACGAGGCAATAT